jgi:hypothetical protein
MNEKSSGAALAAVTRRVPAMVVSPAIRALWLPAAWSMAALIDLTLVVMQERFLDEVYKSAVVLSTLNHITIFLKE